MRQQTLSKSQISGLKALLKALRDEEVEMAEFDFSGPSPRLAKVVFSATSSVIEEAASADIEKSRERIQKRLDERMMYGASE
jgi:hypothetical protein